MNKLPVELLTLNGAIGYNNAVFLLNDICKKHYSNSELGVTARSINLKDIEGFFSEEGIAKRNEYNYGNYCYGDTIEITNTIMTYTPDIYNYVSKDNAGESVNYYPKATIETYRQEAKLEAKQTNYVMVTLKTYFNNEIEYNILFNSLSNCFIASRAVNISGAFITFNLRTIDATTIRSVLLYNSKNVEIASNSYGLRPIVRLNRDVKISELGGTEAMPRTLSR